MDDQLLREAEERLAAFAICQPELARSLGLASESFSGYVERQIWRAVCEGANGELEVADWLSKHEKPRYEFTLSALVKLAEFPPPAGIAANYATSIRKAGVTRSLLLDIHSIDQDQDTATIASQLIDLGEKYLAASQDKRDTAYDGVLQLDGVANNEPGHLPLPWGLADSCPAGAPRDKITLLFGPTGGFKTTVTNGLIRYWCQQGYHVCKVGLEDNATLEYQRLVSVESGRPLHSVIRGNNESLAGCAKDWMKNLVIIDEIPGDPDKIVATVRKSGDFDVVVIDYLQMLDWIHGSERESLHHALVTFQKTAKRDKVAYVLDSQVRQDLIDDSPDKRPTLRHVFGSNTLRTAVKLAIGIYHPWQYYPKGPSTKSDKELYGSLVAQDPDIWPNLIELGIRKQVVGPIEQFIPVLVNKETGAIKGLYE